MITILLTAIVCATPIPIGATVADFDAAKCQFSPTAKTATFQQCEMVRDAYQRSIGPVNFPGYFLCAREDGADDNRASLVAVARQKFNSQKGF
jgi:hypothetical protein